MRSEIIGPAGTKTASGEIGGLSGSKTIRIAVKTAACFWIRHYSNLWMPSTDICSCLWECLRPRNLPVDPTNVIDRAAVAVAKPDGDDLHADPSNVGSLPWQR
jgi:hypothetical protein